MDMPFGIQSVTPELQNVPPPRKHTPSGKSPTCLRLSAESRDAINSHLATVGLDNNQFNYSIKDQRKIGHKLQSACSTDTKLKLFAEEALQLFAHLSLYLPSQEDRDVQNKYAIQKTDAKTIGGKWKRITHYFQCQCCIDNTTGRFASKERQILWKNVGCMSWVKLLTTHVAGEGLAPSFIILLDAYIYWRNDTR